LFNNFKNKLIKRANLKNKTQKDALKATKFKVTKNPNSGHLPSSHLDFSTYCIKGNQLSN
jgi:hypothetical protein